MQVALYSFSMDQILHGSLQSASCGPLKAFAVCSKVGVCGGEGDDVGG